MVDDLIDRLYQVGRILTPDGGERDLFPLSIPRAEGQALREWVVRERAVRTIETGFAYGISALFVCDGLLTVGDPVARHLVIDPNQGEAFADAGLQVVQEAGLASMVEFHQERSEILLPRLLHEGRRFDLGFVDGNHRFDGVFLDLIYLGRLVRDGGVIFVDDYQLPSIAKAVTFCATNLGWTIEEISEVEDLHHWAVLRTTSPPVERDFDHFKDF